MRRILFLLMSILGLAPPRSYTHLTSLSSEVDEKRDQDTEEMLNRSKQLSKLYELPEETFLHEITEQILSHPLTSKKQREANIARGRRSFVFIYLSDGLKVKGLISFVSEPEKESLLMVLRGGNKSLGILNPGGQLLGLANYTIITTVYRDGICEGIDEFGGSDVNDVKNLYDFIPTLEEMLQHQFLNKNKYILGASRGGMQMFLALSRYPELQFQKAISLSGLLDIRTCMAERIDMKQMFENDFGLKEGVNEEDWIKKRDPLLAIEKIDTELPIVIIQGSSDIRVGLEEGYRMVEKLYTLGNNVHYVEVENAGHCLSDRDDFGKLIHYYLENEPDCMHGETF